MLPGVRLPWRVPKKYASRIEFSEVGMSSLAVSETAIRRAKPKAHEAESDTAFSESSLL